MARTVSMLPAKYAAAPAPMARRRRVRVDGRVVMQATLTGELRIGRLVRVPRSPDSVGYSTTSTWAPVSSSANEGMSGGAVCVELRPVAPIGWQDVAVHRTEAERRFRAIADGSFRDVPLYRRLALAIANRPSLLGFAMQLPGHALAGGLVFSTLHYLVLAEVDEEFTAVWRQEEQAPGAREDFEPRFERFVLNHAKSISDLVDRHRGAQLNEVNRCAYLLPALASVAGSRRQPLALLEVGTSAGLLLNFDRYSYRYGASTFGPRSDVSIESEVLSPLPGLEMPEVPWRLGIDPKPINLLDDDAALWLLANVYPGDTARAARVSAAITEARAHPPSVLSGRASDVQVFGAQAPRDLALTVSTTAVLMYLDPTSRIHFRRAIEQLGEVRTVDWLMCEPPSVLASLGTDLSKLVGPYVGGTDFVGPLVRFAPDRERPELLALTGSHARWIDWVAGRG